MRKLMPILGSFALLLPTTVHAGAGINALSGFLQVNVIEQGFIAFQGITLFCLFYFGFKMIVEAGKENAFTDAKNSFVNSLIGFIIIALAQGFVASVGSGNIGVGLNPSAIVPGLESISTFIFTVAQGVLTLMITIIGLKMMSTMGDIGEMANLKKMIVINCIGIVMMRVAESVVRSVNSAEPTDIILELIGFAYFLLTVIGFVAVISFIVAGIFLVISVDESLKDRAKTILISSAIALLVVLACWTILITFASA